MHIRLTMLSLAAGNIPSAQCDTILGIPVYKKMQNLSHH
jgi:hypothetical protein